ASSGAREGITATAATATGPLSRAGTIPSARPLPCAGTLSASARFCTRALSSACASSRPLRTTATGAGAIAATIAETGLAAATGPEHLVATAAAEVVAILGATIGIATKSVRDIGVVIPYALAMLGIMLPSVATVVDVDRPIDVDVVVAPVTSPSPIIST